MSVDDLVDVVAPGIRRAWLESAGCKAVECDQREAHLVHHPYRSGEVALAVFPPQAGFQVHQGNNATIEK